LQPERGSLELSLRGSECQCQCIPFQVVTATVKENSETESVWSLSKNEMMVGPDPQTLRVLVTPVSLGPTGPDALTNLKTVQADF
jgi:hypothetical protein